MAYNKAKAEKEWLRWKEAEEKKLRELGVDEETIQRLHTYDWAEFNKERQYLQRQVEWSSYVDWASAQDLELPSAPKQFLHYFEENDRPQPKLDRMLENGMAVSIGRLREDNQYDYKFVCLSHNTLRGAAGGAVLLAELLAAKGYFD